MAHDMPNASKRITRGRGAWHWRAPAAAALLIAAGTGFPADARVALTVLQAFTGGHDGLSPYAAVVLGTGGALLGTTAGGGSAKACPQTGCGNVFELVPPAPGGAGWIETVLYEFGTAEHGPDYGPLLIVDSPASEQGIYGTTSDILGNNGTIFRLVGHKLTTLWTFSGGSDGGNPSSGLVFEPESGEFFGAASYGASTKCSYGCGTVFETGAEPGSLVTIWYFSGGSDGAYPLSLGGNLLLDTTGALYGTTYGGGSTICKGGCGTVFELAPPTAGGKTWTLTTLWSFSESDGAYPVGGLAADATGALYGTTSVGGGSTNCGTVFKLTPPASGGKDWTRTFWSFSGGDGCTPSSGVIIDKNGTLYGTTNGGGTPAPGLDACSASGCGVVFKLVPPGDGGTTWTEHVLWDLAFTGGSFGNGLTADQNGALYGTTQFGGEPDGKPCKPGGSFGCGVVFQLTGSGFVPQ
jgi:uncharacterized repeat protein (TIGR03803 family)